MPLCSVTHSSVLTTVLRVPVGYRPTSADSVAGGTATATLSAVLVRRRNSGSAFDFHERKFRIKALIGMNWIHISDDDLEPVLFEHGDYRRGSGSTGRAHAGLPVLCETG